MTADNTLRARLDAFVVAAVDLLDALDAPAADMEPEDSWPAHDDDPAPVVLRSDELPGDPAEADETKDADDGREEAA